MRNIWKILKIHLFQTEFILSQMILSNKHGKILFLSPILYRLHFVFTTIYHPFMRFHSPSPSYLFVCLRPHSLIFLHWPFQSPFQLFILFRSLNYVANPLLCFFFEFGKIFIHFIKVGVIRNIWNRLGLWISLIFRVNRNRNETHVLSLLLHSLKYFDNFWYFGLKSITWWFADDRRKKASLFSWACLDLLRVRSVSFDFSQSDLPVGQFVN